MHKLEMETRPLDTTHWIAACDKTADCGTLVYDMYLEISIQKKKTE